MKADIPSLPGLLNVEDVRSTAAWIARIQEPSGAIPWFRGGHTDTWDHVECAMALLVAGEVEAAERAYQWLFENQRPDGKWGTYAIMGDGTVRWIPAEIDPKVLLAMATRAGGEKIADLDAVAPRVDPPGAKPELKTEAKPTERPESPKGASSGPVEIAPPPRAK